MHSMLVTTEELDAMLDRDDVVVVDVRSKIAFTASGHIPRAVVATWHDFSDPNSAIKGLLDPDIGRLEKKLGALGVSKDRQVVVYSNPFDNWGDEGRMYWMLKYLGHPNVRVLAGGWVKWSAEMRRFECGPANPRPAIFKANVDPTLITNKAEVRKLAEASHPDTMLAKHVVACGKEVVCDCAGGVRSAWLYVILKLAGSEKVKNYPGSWWEWGNDYTLPVVNLKEEQRPPIQRTMPNKPPTTH